MSGKRFLAVLLLVFLVFPLANALSRENVNIALYHLTPKQELCRCEAFSYEILVYNTGSFNETYTFSVSAYSSSFNISPSTVTLEPQETARIGIGTRLPCSVTQSGIDFIARTSVSGLRAKTPLQLSFNSSCYAQDVNMTGAVKAFQKQARLLSALLVFLLFLVVILSLLLIFVKRPKKEYWWSSYFKLRPEKVEKIERVERIERKTSFIEIVTIIIVAVFLMLVGLKGFQQVGRNQSLITTYIGPSHIGPSNETLPAMNLTMSPALSKLNEAVGMGVHAISASKQFLWSYKAQILAALVLLMLASLMSLAVISYIRASKAKPKHVKKARQKARSSRWRYLIIAVIILFVLALLAACAFMIYKNAEGIEPFLSGIAEKLRLDEFKSFLLPKLIALSGFAMDLFYLVKPYLLYVAIGIILLLIIIFILRRRDGAVARVITVKGKKEESKKEKPRKQRRRAAKKRK